MKWRFAVPAVVFAALFAVFWLMLHRAGTGEYDARIIQSPLLGKSAPSFRLSQIEDPSKFLDSKDFAGRPYVVNIWGTWCAACRQEHSVLLEIARQNRVPIIGIAWNDDLTQAQRWLNELGNPYAATGNDNEGRVAIDWGVYGAPETFLVDAQGIVLYKHVAPMTLDVWEREFMSRLKRSSP
jgi:cytochrome c biogenesis protein CcmG, thiol:disulfide interchange protein DsbE